MKGKKVGKYIYQKSTRKGKKLMTRVNGRLIHFGSENMEHYLDKTGLLPKKLNHSDEKRRTSYLKRSKGIKNKKNELVYLNPESANYHSIKVLWKG